MRRYVSVKPNTGDRRVTFCGGLEVQVTDVADPESGMGKNQYPCPGSGSGMNIPDYISESLATILGLKYLNSFDADPDPVSGIFLTLGKIPILDPG